MRISNRNGKTSTSNLSVVPRPKLSQKGRKAATEKTQRLWTAVLHHEYHIPQPEAHRLAKIDALHKRCASAALPDTSVPMEVDEPEPMEVDSPKKSYPTPMVISPQQSPKKMAVSPDRRGHSESHKPMDISPIRLTKERLTAAALSRLNDPQPKQDKFSAIMKRLHSLKEQAPAAAKTKRAKRNLMKSDAFRASGTLQPKAKLTLRPGYTAGGSFEV